MSDKSEYTREDMRLAVMRGFVRGATCGAKATWDAILRREDTFLATMPDKPETIAAIDAIIDRIKPENHE